MDDEEKEGWGLVLDPKTLIMMGELDDEKMFNSNSTSKETSHYISG